MSDSTLLIDVVRRLSAVTSLEAAMEIVRRAARELVGADGATFVLREGDVVYYADEDAISPLWKGQRFPISACISGWAITRREAVAIRDIYRDDRVPHDLYRPTFVKSLAMVPIRMADPLGAIGTYWATVRDLSKERLALLTALADATAVTIENVQLIARLKEAKEVAEAREAEVSRLYAEAQDELERRQALERQLTEKLAELESFHDVVVGRELKMMELEKKMAAIKKESPETS